MKIWSIVFLSLAFLFFSACDKNEVSKIPSIGLKYFGPPIVIVNLDTCFLQFSITDGDADLGNAPGSGKYDIYIKDFRFDTGFSGYYFPDFDQSIEDPKKGITGVCTFLFIPALLSPRSDSMHANYADTTHFEVYIKDKAGNESNHFTTPYVIMRKK